jgi:hypothetical protein
MRSSVTFRLSVDSCPSVSRLRTKTFEKIITLAEHEKEAISCPYCRSKNVKQEATAFFAVTSSKS